MPKHDTMRATRGFEVLKHATMRATRRAELPGPKCSKQLQ